MATQINVLIMSPNRARGTKLEAVLWSINKNSSDG